MTYRSQLSPWCILRLLPNLQQTTIARFRRRSEAEECLKALRRNNPDSDYHIVFDPPERST